MYLTEWMLIAIVFLFLLAFYKVGFFFGAKNHVLHEKGILSTVASIQTGLMGLLGVMLAFSFSMSSQRFEQRRQLVIQESMNIGTSYFRAGLLPDSSRDKIRTLLRGYLDYRINYYSRGNSSEEMQKIQTESENLQVAIWAETASLGRNAPSLNTNLNILALNATIDISGNISSSFQSRVPRFIMILLSFIAFCTVLTIGFSDGLSLDRNFPFVIILNVVLCTILLLIVDLDTPTTGFLQSDTYSLVQLKEEIQRYGK